jgi:enoyl-CoA hydratase/carnithine racemase
MKLRITKSSAAHWGVTIDNPPLNLFDPELNDELQALISELEQDQTIKVVVFNSAVPDYFMAHIDLARVSEMGLKPGPTGLSPWPDMALRLQRAPFLTVGVLRGRARGVGSEFLLALDVRFASRERGILAQIEVGCGLIPGGGGLERLPALIGRARSLEAIVGADDFDADMAERYGWVNRSIPDAQLDAFVDRFVRRVASFDRAAISAAKHTINERLGLPKPADIVASQGAFFSVATLPATQARIAELLSRGLQQAGDLELNLGARLGPDPVIGEK